jgi:acyl dehydratase
LSIIPAILQEVVRVQGFQFGVNYGCNKVRFPSPVKVGSKLRLGATIASVESVGDTGAQVVLDVTIEAEGSDKPSCVAQVVYRYTW